MFEQIKSKVQEEQFQREAVKVASAVAGLVASMVVSNIVKNAVANGLNALIDKNHSTVVEIPAE